MVTNASRLDIIYSFFNRGVLVDIYVSVLLMFVPILGILFLYLFNRNTSKLLLFSQVWLMFFGALLIIISATELGFFAYYNSRLTNAVFDWSDNIFLMIRLMFNDATYVPYILLGIFVIMGYLFAQHKIYRRVKGTRDYHRPIMTRLIIFLGSIFLLISGARGTFSFGIKPLNSDDVFFSDTPFLNQLGLNAVFSLVDSYGKAEVNYFEDDNVAIDAALKYLNREKSRSSNPFQQDVLGSDSIHPNIVFIFLESMSNAMVSRYHPEYRTTLFMDSLAQNGIVFDQFYSSGIHTYNGIFSSLYGLPAVLHNPPMKSIETANMHFSGLPTILKEKGYTNHFYITGAKEFDNMNGFLLPNGFDRIIGQTDYPEEMLENEWGVSDRVMFDRVITDCDSLASINQKFLTVALTISTHIGYHIPSRCEHEFYHKNYPHELYEYMDILLKEFFENAKDRPWFDNTVFVLVGDHGQTFNTAYDMSLNYHSVPLIFYAPKLIEPKAINDIGLQLDIFPTLFGLLDFSYTNNGLGVNLFEHKRPFVYFNADNKLGIIDNEQYLIYRSDQNISLFNYQQNETKDLSLKKPLKVDSMLSYAFSMLQSTQYLINHRLVVPENKKIKKVL